MTEEENSNYCKAHSGILQSLKNLEDSDKDQWTVINQLRNRLPVWATLVISILTFLLGAALTYASMKGG